MQYRDPVAEARLEARHRLGCHPDLGHEHDRAATACQRRLGRREVDLGLARAGDPVQQQLSALRGVSRAAPLLRRLLSVEPGDDPSHGGTLSRVEPDRVRRGPDPRGRRAPADGALAQAHQPATLEPAQHVAADALGGQLGGAQLAPRGAEALQRRALARAEPGVGAERRPRVGGGLDHRLAAGARLSPRGRGSRGQHQLESAGGSRAVFARDPEAQPDQVRRGAGLEGLDRLGQALGRQGAPLREVDDHAEHPPAAEGDEEDRSDSDIAQALG